MTEAVRDRPIGVFDSGLGGLTVLKEINRLLPDEDIIYFGDSGRTPYGTKSKDTVIRYTFQDINFLLSHGVKMIVIACNTASACSLPHVTARCPVPVVEVVGPGSRAAASGKKVAVIGTSATIESGVYREALKKVSPEIEYIGKACPLFVPLAEEGWWDNDISRAIASEYLRPIAESGADTLILGCTHYPLLIPSIRAVLGGSVRLINSARTVAAEVRARLEELGTIRPGAGRGPEAGGAANDISHRQGGRISFYTSDSAEKFAFLGSMFLGRELDDVHKIDIESF